jgi:hypothetical protein
LCVHVRMHRYAKFLLLRKHHLELQHPIPPLDIALMWASHMSASGLYASDCQQLLQRSFSDMPGQCWEQGNLGYVSDTSSRRGGCAFALLGVCRRHQQRGRGGLRPCITWSYSVGDVSLRCDVFQLKQQTQSLQHVP